MKTLQLLEQNKGKFIGVQAKDGRTFNAQFKGSTNNYVTFVNTRNGDDIKLSKTNIKRVRVAGETKNI